MMDYLASVAGAYFGYVVGRDFVIKSLIFFGVFVFFYGGMLWFTRDGGDE